MTGKRAVVAVLAATIGTTAVALAQTVQAPPMTVIGLPPVAVTAPAMAVVGLPPVAVTAPAMAVVGLPPLAVTAPAMTVIGKPRPPR